MVEIVAVNELHILPSTIVNNNVWLISILQPSISYDVDTNSRIWLSTYSFSFLARSVVS